jgi:MFS family permease
VGVTAPQVLAALVVAAVALVVFVAAQARGSHPMVPLEVFRSRNVVLLLVVGFTYMVGYYGMPFVFSLYFQQVRGLSALGAGALFVPMMLAGTVLTPFWPRIADRLGRKTLIAGGLSLMTIGLVVLGVLPGSTPVWLLSTLMILVGVGGPLVMPPATAVLLDSVPERRTGTVSGVFNTSRQVGGALAVRAQVALRAGAVAVG